MSNLFINNSKICLNLMLCIVHCEYRMSKEKYLMFLNFRQKNTCIEMLYELVNYSISAKEKIAILFESNFHPIAHYNPNFLQWIIISHTRKIIPSNTCGATTFKQCIMCDLYPYYCGNAIVYLRVFPHRKKEWALKIGISKNLIRPLAQSSPFAIIATNINRRLALYIEYHLSSLLKSIVRNPSGRLLWADIIARSLWDGKEEATKLLEMLPDVYNKIKRDKTYEYIINPLLFIPTKRFATELPSWIEKLPIREIRKHLTRNPSYVKGEVVANRGALLLLEYEDGFWIFEPNESRIYLVHKLVGEPNLEDNHFVLRRMILK